MKKVMMLLAVVGLAFVTQAASFKWATSTGQYVYQAGTSTKMTSGTVYLFDSAVVSQGALLTAVLGGKSLGELTSLSSTSLTASGTFTKTENFASIGADQTVNFYVAIQNGDDVYISATKAGMGQASATTPVNFATTTTSKGAASESTTFGAGGWYKAASTPEGVPEPTSGLLLLVGGALLALRRKQK